MARRQERMALVVATPTEDEQERIRVERAAEAGHRRTEQAGRAARGAPVPRGEAAKRAARRLAAGAQAEA